MRPILNQSFQTVPTVPFTSESVRIPPIAVNHYFVVNSTQAGTLFIEFFDPQNDAWVRVSSDATIAAGANNEGTTIVVELADTEVRTRWVPGAATTGDRVTIFFGTSGAS